MTSVLSEIIDPRQLQRTSTVPDTTSTALAPSTPSTCPVSPANDSRHTTSSEDDDEDEGNQAPPVAQNSPDTSAAFAINTARNLRLSANGEKSLLNFSRVFFPLSYSCAKLFTCVKLDVKSALVYQQATLIKLNETQSVPATTTTAQGSGVSSDRLVLTSEIKVLTFMISCDETFTFGCRI